MSYDYKFQKMMNEVHHYYEIGRYEQTIIIINQIMATKPNDSYLLYLRANCLLYLDQYLEAKDNCKQALTYGYSACECNYLLGLIYMNMSQYIQAEECYLEALRQNPQRADIVAVYGYLMLKTGHDKKSAKLMEEALKMDPQNETVLHYRFYYYLAKSKKEDQITVLEQYLQVSSSEIRNYIKFGMMEFENGNHKAAGENFKQAFLLDPTNNHILSILQSAEESASVLFLPQRIINKLGGPAVVWIAMIVIIMILQQMELSKLAVIVTIIYIGICVYTWITPILYKIILRNK